jgi:hypothetical protein
MKNIVLTLDYELFFGTQSGTVANCMTIPMQHIATLLKKYDCRATIFWDVLHFMRAKELQVVDEVKMIEDSIKRLVLDGHDIQLHIHSHWIDAKFENGKWSFPSYEHYKLQSLNQEMIDKIVTQAVGTIEELTKTKVTTFRAGGWQIEPFDDIRASLAKCGIFFDSSVANNKYQNSGIASFDFRGYPKDDIYKFELSPKIKDDKGRFVEYQIKSIYIPNYLIFSSYLKKIFLKERYPIFGDGKGAGNIAQSKWDVIKLLLKRVFLGSSDMLSLEFTSRMIFAYMIHKASNNAVMIGHPKSIGMKHLEVLEELLKNGTIRFVSLKELL